MKKMNKAMAAEIVELQEALRTQKIKGTISILGITAVGIIEMTRLVREYDKLVAKRDNTISTLRTELSTQKLKKELETLEQENK
jgi:hypothetical protein